VSPAANEWPVLPHRASPGLAETASTLGGVSEDFNSAMMAAMKILVLGGGDSPERDVSLRSSKAVRQALVALGHEVWFEDPVDGDEVVERAAHGMDLVMPILHGAGGEDGRVQRVLERVGVPYLGAGVAASELCFDKMRLKELMERRGILTPASEVVTAETFWDSRLVRAPFVLKPVEGGSSLGVLIARELPFDEAKARKLLGQYREMLLEELIEGVEITVSVLGQEALPVIEIVPPEGDEFDYENKYNGATSELCPPRHVARSVQAEAQRIAERLHRLAGVRHLSRTDMMVRPDGKLFVLELNTLPGMTAESLFPKAAAVAGLNWEQLVARLVELALAG
jgi:D-alanine-D-alanine ligase